MTYMQNIKLQSHQYTTIKITEVISESIIISTVEDALNLMEDLYYQGYDATILYEATITPAFFDFKTGIAVRSFRSFRTTACVLLLLAILQRIKVKALTIFLKEVRIGKSIL